MNKLLLAAFVAVWGGVFTYAVPAYADRTDQAAKLEKEEVLVYVAANRDGCMVGCPTDAEYFASDEYKQAKYANDMLAKFRRERE